MALHTQDTARAATLRRPQAPPMAHHSPVIAALLRWLGLATTMGMFLVLVMGSLVTNTGSGKGCGSTWPLCRGQFIPQFAVSTLIEWSHRAVTGVVGILIVALTVGVLALYRQRREIQILAPAMSVFLIAQAILGMIAAGHDEHPAALALHFGVSLIAFSSIALTTAFLWELGGAEELRDRAAPRGVTGLIWGSLGFTYLIVYLGAFVRHVSANLACGIEWPLCNGALVPPLDLLNSPVGAHYAHRLAALTGTLLIVALTARAYRARGQRPDLYRGSLLALALIVLQALSGAIVLFSRIDLLSTLLHSALVTLLFGCLSYLALHTLRRPASGVAYPEH